MIEELVPDGLWERVAPLLPPPKPRRHRYPGRRPIEDRTALAGIVFVLTFEVVLDKKCWVVERGFAWLHGFKRLRTRYEHRADLHLALMQLACTLICYRQLRVVLK